MPFILISKVNIYVHICPGNMSFKFCSNWENRVPASILLCSINICWVYYPIFCRTNINFLKKGSFIFVQYLYPLLKLNKFYPFLIINNTVSCFFDVSEQCVHVVVILPMVTNLNVSPTSFFSFTVTLSSIASLAIAMIARYLKFVYAIWRGNEKMLRQAWRKRVGA